MKKPIIIALIALVVVPAVKAANVNATSTERQGMTTLYEVREGFNNLAVGGTLTNTLTVAKGITVTAGGITATDGGLTVTAGGLTVTAGGLTVTAGNIQATAGSLITGVGVDGVGAVDMDYGSADITDHTFVTDGTGDAEIVLPANSVSPIESLYHTQTSGTKSTYGIPIVITFSPTAAETLTYTVPAGYDLVVWSAVANKETADGAHADDQIDLQNNDGSAANIFAREELTGVTDGTFFSFDGLDPTEQEIESGNTLDCVTTENGAGQCDAHIVVTGILKVAD